ncbi:MAG: hypothetical protein L0Z53_27850 [Acidobacteriales bacterium]|nr:hypothetical protein [Terriglobales bacterium]
MRDRYISMRLSAAAVIAALLLAGCSLRVDKEKSGKSENVEIETPMGGLKVRTNIDAKDIGLSVYPNARPVQDRHDDDEDSANVNISTPFFSLKVLAMKFESDDPPDKIAEFYRKDMNRYGKVVECRGRKHSGRTKKDRDRGELTLTLDCDDEDPGSKDIELKVGEGRSQHIVGVSPKGKGSEFGLVYIQVRGSERETM